MHVSDVTMFSKIISNNDKGKDQRNAKQNKSTRAASGIINTFYSLWICVAILLHMASKTTVEVKYNSYNMIDRVGWPHCNYMYN